MNMVEAVVEYDYTAQEPDELTIRKGDVIRDILKKPGGWWEGTLRDKRGMFPDNFVTVIHKESKVQQRAKSIRALRQCRAIFSYHPAHDDELNLSVGDIIDVIGEVEDGWWKGRLGECEGVFPSNFVAEIDAGKSHSKSSREDLSNLQVENDGIVPNLPPKPSKIICQVKYHFDACNEDELTLREGELITLISKDGQDRGWWRGELHGRIGVFPDNFVTVIPTPELNGPPLHKQERRQDKISPNKVSPILGDSPKPNNVAAHRKSLDLKTEDRSVPPIPGKKPSVPKKSPSSVSTSGALAGLKQKPSDIVDGASSSRMANTTPPSKGEDKDSDFDQIERSSLLLDMRANRAKAPGRRPPSVVYKDNENLVNGNSDHVLIAQSELVNDKEETEKKPKVRQWEKQEVPWVKELKLNQAKRTSVTTPPLSTDPSRLKLTPTNDKITSPSDNNEDPKTYDVDSSPVDMSKSMSALSSSKLKTPINETEYVILRNKTPSQPITVTPSRPQSIHGVLGTSPLESSKVSPIVPTQSHSPITKPPIAEKVGPDAKTSVASPRTSFEKKSDTVSMKQYMDLVEKVALIETKMTQKFQEMQSKIEELQGELQIEGDMRRLFQLELEKVAQCVTQV